MVKRRLILIVTAAITLIAFYSFSTKKPIQKAAIKTLIIDPGHGGIDPGTKGSFSTEAEVSLAVALKFGKTIEKEYPDIKIIYTRTTDEMAGNKRTPGEGNRYRATLANESAGDLFISFHCNSAPAIRNRKHTGYKNVTSYTGKGSKRKKVTRQVATYSYTSTPNPAHGTETYIWAVNKNDAKVSAVNKTLTEDYGEMDSTIVQMELPDPSDPAEKARMLIYAQYFFNKSLALADFVEKEFVAKGRLSRGVKQRNHTGIWVLQATGMPSILIELGFLSNREEEEYLNSEKGQQESADAVFKAFTSYKEMLEHKPTTTPAPF